jgi:hypothetical protein
MRRLRTTPMRDVLRGRVTGRLDVDRVVAAFDLPPSLADLVLDVTRRTRLWRIERSDVAAELAAHFADGVESGADAEDLRRSFGDPARAARLIRRARKRTRPLAWRWLRRSMLALAALVLVYAGAGLMLVLGRPSPHTDYLTRLTGPVASIPDDARAWPDYRAALVEIGEIPDFGREWPHPGNAAWPQAAEFLEARQGALDRVRRAAARPDFGYVPGYAVAPEDRVLWPEMEPVAPRELADESLFAILLPYLAETRKLAKILALDTHAAAADGRRERVLENLEAMLGVARHVREFPTLIGDLVSMAIVALTVQTAGDILAERPKAFEDAGLQRLAHVLSACDPIFEVRYDAERLTGHDLAQRLYTDDGSGDGRITLEGVRMLHSLVGTWDWRAKRSGDSPVLEAALLPSLVWTMASRREFLREYDRLMDRWVADGTRPLWEIERYVAEEEVERMMASPLMRVRYLPIVYLMPALGKIHQSAEFGRADRDGLLVAIALDLHRRRHGAWPADLDPLVPDLLPAVPPDRLDGRPLRYTVEDGRAIVYSIGADRDDDGGRVPTSELHSPLRVQHARRWVPPGTDPSRIPDGDWILWQAPPSP